MPHPPLAKENAVENFPEHVTKVLASAKPRVPLKAVAEFAPGVVGVVNSYDMLVIYFVTAYWRMLSHRSWRPQSGVGALEPSEGNTIDYGFGVAQRELRALTGGTWHSAPRPVEIPP